MRRKGRWIPIAALVLAVLAWVAWLRFWPAAARAPAPYVDLAVQDGRTVDFSSGRPVVKDSAADRAAIEAAKQEMAAAAQGVVFGPATPATPPPPSRPPPAAAPATSAPAK